MGLPIEGDAKNVDEVPSIVDFCEDVHSKVKAVIYSFLNVESAYALSKTRHFEDSPPRGDEMMPFFRQPFSVYLNSDFFLKVVNMTAQSIEKVSS